MNEKQLKFAKDKKLMNSETKSSNELKIEDIRNIIEKEFKINKSSTYFNDCVILLRKIIDGKYKDYNNWISKRKSHLHSASVNYVNKFFKGLRNYLSNDQNISFDNDGCIFIEVGGIEDEDKTENNLNKKSQLEKIPQIKNTLEQKEIEKLKHEKNELEKANLKKIIVKNASEQSDDLNI